MELLVLVLNAGMASADLAATLDKLKEQSKSIGAHKKRQLFWDAYTKMASKANNLADGTFCFFSTARTPPRTTRRATSRWWSSPSARKAW